MPFGAEGLCVRGDQTKQRLISWKEIAHYLQCEERTAQRWEQERGLPVHRVPGDKRGTVFVFKDDIDAWLRQQPAQVSTLTDRSVKRTHVDEPGGDHITPPEGVGHDPASNVLPSQEIPLHIAGVQQAVSQRRVMFWGGIALITVAAFWLRGLAVTQSAQTIEDRVPDKYQYAGTDLVIQNRFGRALWSHRFDGPLHVPDEGADPWRRVNFEDLDGDGSIEVIVAVGYESSSPMEPNNQNELYCFTSRGTVRWRYRFMEPLTFGGRTYGPPYSIRTAIVAGDRRKYVWIAYVHHPWWPTILLKLDAEGREVGRFVNAGYIYSLVYVRNSRGSFIVAGGVNNEYNAGILAILDADIPTGTSPQTDASPYECTGCPRGGPLHYFVFHRSELNRFTGSAYNAVYNIRLLNDRVDAITLETQADPTQRSESHYEFDMNFQLIGAHRGDAYWNVHRAQELQGAVRHTADRCPEHNNPLRIREWRNGAWQDTRPLDTLSTRR